MEMKEHIETREAELLQRMEEDNARLEEMNERRLALVKKKMVDEAGSASMAAHMDLIEQMKQSQRSATEHKQQLAQAEEELASLRAELARQQQQMVAEAERAAGLQQAATNDKQEHEKAAITARLAQMQEHQTRAENAEASLLALRAELQGLQAQAQEAQAELVRAQAAAQTAQTEANAAQQATQQAQVQAKAERAAAAEEARSREDGLLAQLEAEREQRQALQAQLEKLQAQQSCLSEAAGMGPGAASATDTAPPERAVARQPVLVPVGEEEELLLTADRAATAAPTLDVQAAPSPKRVLGERNAQAEAPGEPASPAKRTRRSHVSKPGPVAAEASKQSKPSKLTQMRSTMFSRKPDKFVGADSLREASDDSERADAAPSNGPEPTPISRRTRAARRSQAVAP